MTRTRSHNLRPARRSGLVLIFVVVILVLLAVMVTAYLASVRLDAAPLKSDIGGAVQSGGGSSIDSAALDTHLGSLTSKVKQALINDLFNTGTANPGNYRAPGYEPWDAFSPAIAATKDVWLASSTPVETTAGSGVPMWKHVSRWMGPDNFFEDPRYRTLGAGALTYLDVMDLEPTAAPVGYVYGGTPQDRYRLYPALRTSGGPRIAADADGDGVADAGLFYIDGPATPLVAGNILYYGAVRIVDNAAFVNVNTAWRRDRDVRISDGNPIDNNGFFLANVGLYELLRPAFQADGSANDTDIDKLNIARLGNNPSVLDVPFDDSGAARGDFVFSTWAQAFDSQIGRRIDNPGRRNAGSAYVSMRGENIPALHYHGTLINPFAGAATVELALNNSLYASAANYAPSPGFTDRIFSFYPAAVMDGSGSPDADVKSWFAANYHVGDATSPNTAPNIRSYVTAYNPVANAITRHYWAGTALPTDMHAYSSVQPVKASVNTSDFPTLWRAYWNVMCDDGSIIAARPNNAAMFDSPLRGGTALSPRQTQLLRAALAAVNTIDLRDADFNVTSRAIRLPTDGGFPERTVTVYGQEWQPWITEVMVDRENGKPDKITLELYNPYPASHLPAGGMPLSGWKLIALDRATMTVTELYAFTAADNIAGDGFLILESEDSGAGRKVVAPLANAADKELVLVRPRLLQPTAAAPAGLSSGVDLPANVAYDENFPEQMVPADQVDLLLPALNIVGGETRAVWHYHRKTTEWGFVYPGEINLASTPRMANFLKDVAPLFTTGSFGSSKTDASNGGTSYSIQVANVDMPGPYRVIQPSGMNRNIFPFGGFARNGDILTVPYFGAYRVLNNTGTVLEELTGSAFDAAFVNLGVAGENIGRFCPDPDAPANGYQWAAKLFDYLAVRTPATDALPNVETDMYRYATGGFTGLIGATPQPVANAGGAANIEAESLIPNQGLINVNTAPWEVIAMLPMIPGNAAANEALAREIVSFREANGPYKTLFDLNKLPGVKAVALAQPDPDDAWGDVSPVGGGTDGVSNDFESQYLLINRISNLATVRSDSFTCYVLVQAWEVQTMNGGGLEPRLVDERRAAFIVDRGTITPTKYTTNDLKVIGIPTR